MKNLPLKYKIAKELVALMGIIELVFGTYIGYQFGEGDSPRAWVCVGLLALVSWSSTRLWIWVLEKMNDRT